MKSRQNRMALAIAALALCAPAAPTLALAQPVLLQTIEGPAANGNLGVRLADAGDVDGDGRTDSLVTARPFTDAGESAGRVYLYSGATGDLLHTFDGVDGAGFGRSTDGVGDVDGDGFSDVIIGAAGTTRGDAYVYSGADGAPLYTYEGDADGDHLGRAVSGVGDEDGDGTPDFAFTNRRGVADIRSGADGSRIRTIANSQTGFGTNMRRLCDVDGDGVPDLAITAPSLRSPTFPAGSAISGHVFVYSGADGSLLHDIHEEPLLHPYATDYGQSIDRAPDTDGDGVCDIAVLAPRGGLFPGVYGKAYFHSGATGALLHTWYGESADFSFFSGMIAGLPDLNQDGFGDVAISGFLTGAGVQTNQGQVRLYSGKTGAMFYALSIPTPSVAEGPALLGLPDADGAGHGGFLVSQPYAATGAGARAGVVYRYAVLSGCTGPDADRDGYPESCDCDDHNAAVHPGAVERCNVVDDNCDGRVDEGYDEDGDGYRIPACGDAIFDCDDRNPAVHPGAAEIPGNEIDDDCDDMIDEAGLQCGLGAAERASPETWFAGGLLLAALGLLRRRARRF